MKPIDNGLAMTTYYLVSLPPTLYLKTSAGFYSHAETVDHCASFCSLVGNPECELFAFDDSLARCYIGYLDKKDGSTAASSTLTTNVYVRKGRMSMINSCSLDGHMRKG